MLTPGGWSLTPRESRRLINHTVLAGAKQDKLLLLSTKHLALHNSLSQLGEATEARSHKLSTPAFSGWLYNCWWLPPAVVLSNTVTVKQPPTMGHRLFGIVAQSWLLEPPNPPIKLQHSFALRLISPQLSLYCTSNAIWALTNSLAHHMLRLTISILTWTLWELPYAATAAAATPHNHQLSTQISLPLTIRLIA